MLRMCLLIVALFMASGGAIAGQSAKVCMFPFIYETIVPVTEVSIESVCEKIVVEEDNELFKNMMGSIRAHEPMRFGSINVRVRIELSTGDVIFIGKNGEFKLVGVKYPSLEYQMDQPDLEGLKYYLYRMY